MISSEKQLRQPSTTLFPSTLAQACIKVSILKYHLLQLQHHFSKIVTIQCLQEKLTTPLPLPVTIPQSRIALRQTHQDVREIRKEAISQ